MAKLIINNRYGIVPNGLLNNPNLTFKAKGLFAYIQSKPDGWNFSAKNISNQTKESIDAVRTGLVELEEHGYLVRTKYNRENGLLDIEYTLYSDPVTENPTTDKPSLENPTTENPTTIVRKNSSKKELSKKEFRLTFFEKSIDLIEAMNFSIKAEKDLLTEWINYKHHVHKEHYKTEKFALKFIKDIKEFGFVAVKEAMYLSIASEYKGYFPKKIKNTPQQAPEKLKINQPKRNIL